MNFKAKPINNEHGDEIMPGISSEIRSLDHLENPQAKQAATNPSDEQNFDHTKDSWDNKCKPSFTCQKIMESKKFTGKNWYYKLNRAYSHI